MFFCSVATLDHNLQFVQRNYEFSSVGFCAGDIMLPGTNSLALKTMTIILVLIVVVVVGRPAVCEASTLGANVMQYKNGKRKEKNTTGRGETESRSGREKAQCAWVLKEMLTFELFVSGPHTIVDKSLSESVAVCWCCVWVPSRFLYLLFASSCTFSCCTVWRNYNWSEVVNEFQLHSLCFCLRLVMSMLTGRQCHLKRAELSPSLSPRSPLSFSLSTLFQVCGKPTKLSHNFITMCCSASFSTSTSTTKVVRPWMSFESHTA